MNFIKMIVSGVNRTLYLLYRPLKLLMDLGQEDCPPSTFGLFANDAAKLIHYSNLFLSVILSTKK